MKNRIYETTKERYERPLNLQMFAEDGDGGSTGDGNDSGAGEGDDSNNEDDKGGDQKPTFDDFLKDADNQSEFDRRVNKAIDKAVSNAQRKWQTLTDDKVSEAEKLAKMNKDEKAEYQRTKERQEFKAEKAAFEREKLTVEIKSDLQKQGLPIAFADSLAVIGDAGKIKVAMTQIKETWDAEITEAIKSKARQTPPNEGGTGVNGNGQMSDIRKMAVSARIIK